MSFNVRHWLLGGGILLGAATVGFWGWWATARDEQPTDAGLATALGAGGSLVSDGPHTRRKVPTGPHEHGTDRAPPASSTPQPAHSPQDLGALLEIADSPEGEVARRATAGRIATIRDEGRRRVANGPSSALAWALEQGDMARLAMQVVVGEWARVDPAAAFEAVRQIADGGPHASLRAHGLALVVDTWATIDPAAALQGVGTLSSSPGTGLLQGRILATWAEHDPVTASMSLEPLIGEGARGAEAQTLGSTVSNVAYRLGQEDPMEAADWALALPEESTARTNALSGAVAAWIDDDPQAVGAWLDAMDPGPTRDAGVTSVVKAYAAEAPETALAWAETISDKAQRSSLCAVAAARWLSKDPERAEAWIRTAPVLSDAQRAAILEAHRIIPEPVIDRE